jgi:hypothetical protein
MSAAEIERAPLPLGHWRLRRNLKQALRRLQTAAGCATSVYCGSEGITSLCERCMAETKARLYVLGTVARLDPALLLLLLSLEGFERAEAELYGGGAG